MNSEFTPEKAVRLAREGRYDEAMKIFEKNLLSALNPKDLSFYALSLAASEEDYDRAVTMCISAAEKEFYNPEIYLNLGKTLLLCGKKTKAIKVFKKGLKFDETNKSIRMEIKKLGLRRAPIISFLSRGNVLNRMCGILACRATSRG